VPTSSNRNSVKVFGCVNVFNSNFLYQFSEFSFNTESYLNFLENKVARFYYPHLVYYIQDNASYHKDSEVWRWFKANHSWLKVKNLPPYCPELNAAESIWRHTRKEGMHNQYFDTKDA
jgi:transposase